MNRDNIETKFANGKQVVNELEKLIKSQQTDFKTHEIRLNWLRFVFERLQELHDLELSALDKPEVSEDVSGV